MALGAVSPSKSLMHRVALAPRRRQSGQANLCLMILSNNGLLLVILINKTHLRPFGLLSLLH